MKDLDFDELDRAVNSLMTNVPKTAPQVAESKEKTLDITPTLDAGASPSFDKVEAVAAQAVALPQPTTPPAPKPTGPRTMNDITPRSAAPVTAPARPQPSQAPAARRGSKFMDVVRPTSVTSSDSTPVSRQGVTIHPSATVTPEPIAPKTDDTVSPPAPAPVEPSASDWPDPLDMQTPQSSVPDDSDKNVKKPASDNAVDNATPEPAQPEPLVSPFLPDAKVEKRPLGSPVPVTPELSEPVKDDDIVNEATTLSTDDVPAESTDDIPNEKDTASSLQLPPNPVATNPEAQLPEELSGDLMAVEADTTHDELKKVHDSGAITEQSDESENDSAPKSSPEPAINAVEKESAPVPVGPTSIAQQYHESPSTGDKDNGSIYDTSTYHQPLANTAKKSSGKKVILWIVIIILVGIAAGVALYYSRII